MRKPKHLGPWDLSVGSSLWAPGPPAQAQILIYTLGVRAGKRPRSQLSSTLGPLGGPWNPHPQLNTALESISDPSF